MAEDVRAEDVEKWVYVMPRSILDRLPPGPEVDAARLVLAALTNLAYLSISRRKTDG